LLPVFKRRARTERGGKKMRARLWWPVSTYPFLPISEDRLSFHQHRVGGDERKGKNKTPPLAEETRAQQRQKKKRGKFRALLSTRNPNGHRQVFTSWRSSRCSHQQLA